MITIIFLDDNKTPVSITFTHDSSLNASFEYGQWNKEKNVVTINDDGWEILQKNRNNIRNLKPMMDRLEIEERKIKVIPGIGGGVNSIFVVPIDWFE